MNTTELGVYILGATALSLLSMVGIASGNARTFIAAAVAAGAAYLAQFCAALTNAVDADRPAIAGAAATLGVALMLASWAGWLFGVWNLYAG